VDFDGLERAFALVRRGFFILCLVTQRTKRICEDDFKAVVFALLLSLKRTCVYNSLIVGHIVRIVAFQIGLERKKALEVLKFELWCETDDDSEE
jgi:hypothetical protein